MTESKKKWVEYPYKKDYVSPTVNVHWAHLEKPDPGNPDFNIKPNHQITLVLEADAAKKIMEIAATCGASKGVSGFREKVDDTGASTGKWLLTCKTTQYVANNIDKFPEVFDTAGNQVADTISRGDEVTVIATPGLVTVKKTLSFFLNKVTLVKKSAPSAAPQTSRFE